MTNSIVRVCVCVTSSLALTSGGEIIKIFRFYGVNENDFKNQFYILNCALFVA